MRMPRISPASFLILVLTWATWACSDGTGPSPRLPLTVSFSAAGSVTADATAPGDLAPNGSLADAVSGDALVITRAQLVVARMELARAGAVCTSDDAAGDDDDGDDDCAELELAPSVVELPVNGTVVDELSVAVPAGSYSALEARMRPIRDNGGRGHGSAAFLLAHPDLEGVSVLVEGTFNGSPFTFTSDVSTGAEQTFAPPLDVGDTPLNLTVQVDLAAWFASSSGGLIDPRTATAGTEDARLIAANIKRSFRAFRDDDHDGHEDHGDHDGDGGDGGHH